MSRSKKHAHEEEHENHERWLVTYADMVTLLMVLFIVMFAMSQVDQKKFLALKDGLAAGFGQSDSVMTGSSNILDQPGTSVVEPVTPNKSFEDAPTLEALEGPVAKHEREQAQRAYGEAAAEADRLGGVAERVRRALRKRGLASDVRTTIDARGLTVSLVSQHVVFESNLASLTDRGRRIVTTLAPVLRDLPDLLQIEGHTNQLGSKPKYYASDWDLSAARAVTVLRYLNEVGGVPARRLAAVGFGQIKPLVDPRKPGSQKLNKRVDIVIMSGLADSSGELLEQVLGDRERAAKLPKSTKKKKTTTRATAAKPASASAKAGEPAETATDTEGH